MALINFNNRYGKLELEMVGNCIDVGTIRGEDLPEDLKFSLAIAEQVALITENKSIQIVFERMLPRVKAYVVVHRNSVLATPARIRTIDFYPEVVPSEELKTL